MEDYGVKEVNIVDIKMPFWSMVIFMVKATIAAIPAMIILTGLWFLVLAVLVSIGSMDGIFDVPN